MVWLHRDQPPIAVICALEEELVHLRAALPTGREDWHGPRRAWLTALGEQSVVLAICGIGMLSAAAVAEAVIARYRPAVVLNYGCAGAHRADLTPGDVVIGARVIAYDSVRQQADGAERFAYMRHLYRDEQRKVEAMPAALDLLTRAQRLSAEVEGALEPWPPAVGWPDATPHRPPRVVVGAVASADRWNRAPATIRALAARYGSACEDMEAAAIALTCASHDAPFLTIKDISNNELLKTTDAASFTVEFEQQIGRRAAALTLALLRELAATSAPSGPDDR